MKSAAAWVDDTPVDREALAAILKCDDLAPAQRAIVRARGYVAQGTTSTDVKALRENLDSLRSALARMQRTLGFMDGNDHFLDEHYCITNDGDTALMALRQRTGSTSGFSALVQRMAAAVDDYAQESAQEATQGRSADGSHTLAICELAELARSHGVKVTSSRGSRFPRLVALVFPELGKDPRRAIERALEKTTQ